MRDGGLEGRLELNIQFPNEMSSAPVTEPRGCSRKKGGDGSLSPVQRSGCFRLLFFVVVVFSSFALILVLNGR